MALTIAQGEITITAAGGTGNKNFAHGLGLDPSGNAVLLLMANLQAAGGGSGASAEFAFGAAKSATEEFAVVGYLEDAAATSDTTRTVEDDACLAIMTTDGSTSIDLEVDFVSFDATNFTLNVSNAPAADQTVQWMIIYHASLSVDVGTIGVLSTDSGATAFAGIGFQAKFGIWATAGFGAVGASDGYSLSYGMADSAGNQWAIGHRAANGAAAADCSLLMDNDAVINALNTGSSTLNAQYAFTSWDADGFTLNVVNPPATTHVVGYIVLGGADLLSFVGTDTQPTSATTDSLTTTGQTPELILLAHTNATALSTSADSIKASLGWSVGTSSHRSIAIADQDAADPTVTGRRTSATKSIMAIADTDGSVLAEGSISAVAANSATLDWTTADAVARLLGYAALAFPTAAGGTGLAVFVEAYNRQVEMM